MARSYASILTVLLLAGGVPGFGQLIPGVGYPGGGYPGGRRNRPPIARQPDQPATLFVGMLRKIEDKDVIIEAEDDKKITTISISGSTKYVSDSGGKANIGDFQPGDHVSVSTHQDSKGLFHAQTVTMVRAGTPDEHSAASAATGDTSRPITTTTSTVSPDNSSASSSGSNDNGHPTLRRAASSSGSAAASSAPASSSDDDHPTLRRAAPSLGGTASNSPAPAPAPVSVDDHPRLRRAVSGPDDGLGAQMGPAPAGQVDSATTATPAPPQLRRASPAPSSTPASEPGTLADARPSLRADNTNGRRMAESMPTSSDPFIDQTREAAFAFSETLPNYVVKQYTTRYATASSRRGGGSSWQVLDTVTADVIEEDGKEKYKNILVNGKPPVRDIEKSGSWSRGEFSSLLQDVLSPVTNADFHNKRPAAIVNRAAWRYDFTVEQPNSHWHVEVESGAYMPGYSGSIWIDKANNRVLRIEMSAEGMPSSFALDQVEWAVDYDYVLIGEGKYLLPVHSEALSCARTASSCTRNVIEFRNYRKFTADTSITFDTAKQ